MGQVQSFGQSCFFKIKIKYGRVINFSFFTMNHFVHAGIGRVGEHLPKCTVTYSQGRRVKIFDFFVNLINEWSLTTEPQEAF